MHGNLDALNSVLHSIDQESPDQVISLGDVAATGPKPCECLDILKKRNISSVMGNTDEGLLKPVTPSAENEDLKVIEEVDQWCHEQLKEEQRSFLRTFKPTIELEIGVGLKLIAFHGSPISNMEWISSASTDEELERALSSKDASIMAGGHTHTQLLRRYRETILINPGSVGLPFERNRLAGRLRIAPWSEYGVLESKEGELTVSFRRAPFDLGNFSRSILASQMPHRESFLQCWTRYIERMLVENKLA